MVENVKDFIFKEHRRRGISGKPLVSARVTQLYEQGACVYFYFLMDFSGLGERASAVYDEMETGARNVIMANGGSVSHHHGIGKHRGEYMKGGKAMSEGMEGMVQGIKKAIDPDDIFGVKNGSFFVGEEG